jgi:hypothetical protein
MRPHLRQFSCRLKHRYLSAGLPQGDSGSEATNACAHNAHMNTLTHLALSLLALHCLSKEWKKLPLFCLVMTNLKDRIVNSSETFDSRRHLFIQYLTSSATVTSHHTRELIIKAKDLFRVNRDQSSDVTMV